LAFQVGVFASPLRATLAILMPTAFFIIWDATGIALGIFFRGHTHQLTGLMLAPELPIEEPVFWFCSATPL